MGVGKLKTSSCAQVAALGKCWIAWTASCYCAVDPESRVERIQQRHFIIGIGSGAVSSETWGACSFPGCFALFK